MKKLLQSLLAGMGYDLYRRDARFHPELAAVRFAERANTGTILDVGANVGQYGKALRKWGYRGKILSFEPLSTAHRQLTAAAEGDAAWQVAPRCAIGAVRSTAEINVSANSVSSSLLGMLETHEKAAPGSAYAGKEQVEVLPLDELVPTLCPGDSKIYLKIDTQGFEKSVLEGATETLRRCSAVQMELSLTPLYEGGFLFAEGIEQMTRAGFQTYAVFQGFTDRETGQTFQVDAVFVPNR